MTRGKREIGPKIRPVDPREFETGYTNARGVTFYAKPGRKKKLSAEQAALIFECQVQIRAAQALIDRTLEAAGVAARSSSGNILKNVWRDRGRIDILHKARNAPNAVRRPSATKRSPLAAVA